MCLCFVKTHLPGETPGPPTARLLWAAKEDSHGTPASR